MRADMVLRHMADGQFCFGEALPDLVPHTAGHHAVHGRHAVGLRRHGEGQQRHVEGVGAIFINNKITTGTFDFVLRGTAPKPANISLDINENGKRTYSITELINNLDIGVMRAFIKTHDKF